MSGATTKRRSRSLVETQDDADAARFGGGGNSSSDAPDGYKRMRLRGGNAPSELETEDDEGNNSETAGFHSFAADDDNVTPPRTIGRGRTNGESATEFSAGAVVRVRLEDFLTYDKAEFFPGPSMNMIIGPNGSGKSSLVCAICLGLGYPPSVLGRADKIGEFVKHGKENACIEIELQKRPQDRANYVVRLEIDREKHKRTFRLNGRPTTAIVIKKLMQTLRIQIDNLCQFLPQDKVSEFAGYSPIDLLDKTLQAAAPEEVMHQQKELKQMFDAQKALKVSLETEAEQLRSLETRQQGVQADVERMREREQILKVVADLKDARLVADYQEKKTLFEQVKEQKKRAQQQLARLEQRTAPSLEDVNNKVQYESQVGAVLEARKVRAKAAGVDVDKALQAIENLKERIQDFENKKNAEGETMSKKRQGVSEQRTKITKLEAQYKNGKDIASTFNASEWNHKIRECESRLANDVKDEEQDLTAVLKDVRSRGTEKRTELQSVRREVNTLDSQEGQRLQQLKRSSPEAAKAYEWLQDHRDQFDKEVFGPPILTCSMKDKRYSDHVQVVLQQDDVLCFTAQTKNDHKKLTDHFFKTLNVAVPVRTIMTDLSNFRPPVPPEHLKDLGLDGYAVDFIEGPEPVLAMLCSEKKLHLTGVALKEISDQQFKVLNDGEKISSFATGKTYYRITRRREYGPGATSTMTKTIQAGRYWTDEPVDAGAKAGLEQRQNELRDEVEQLTKQFREIKEKLGALAEQAKEIEAERDRLDQEKTQLQREFNQWNALPNKIEIGKNTLQRVREELEETKQRLLSYDDEFDKLALRKARLSLQHQERLSILREATQAALEAHIRHIEAVSDVAALKERNVGIMQRLNEERSKVDELDRQVKQGKMAARKAQEAIKDLLAIPGTEEGEMDTDRRDYLIGLAEGKTVETISEDIETENAKLELIHAADPGILRQFENRAQEIESLQRQNATKRADLAQLSEQIQELQRLWEPALDEMIRRINDAFSYNFEQINCAGEVGVHKDEDFDKWSIEINVKFRENETLQRLDQHRQSGGERAVTTIFYLMSLQSMAQSPFRMIDEINQGMDPRNERTVHERMVKIACREHTSQYFLLTPKLLSGLMYDERMKVLCVASGEHMPDEGGKLDFAKCVKIKRRLLSTASA